jgi:hypothetical protein
MRVVYQIEAGAESPADARRIVAGELGRFVQETRLDDLKLLISELVTGRVRRDLPGSSDALLLDLQAQDVIRCSIQDTGPPELPDSFAARILDHLADRWGMTRRGEITQLWFEAQLAS